MVVCSLRSRSFVAVAAVLVCAAAARAEDPVLVSITGPLVGRVGERTSFEVELVNRSGKPLQGLRVIDYFDKGFHHEASTSPIEQKGTIDLMPGTARRLTLDFLLDEPGRQCHRVEILAAFKDWNNVPGLDMLAVRCHETGFTTHIVPAELGLPALT
jgi:hypothetical protein